MSGNSWAAKHKNELLAAGAIGAALFTGGSSLGLLGGLGAGAAAAGEGAAAGAAGAAAAGGLEAGAGAAAGGLAGSEAIGAGAGTMAGGMASAGLGGGAALGDSEMALANSQYAGAHPFNAAMTGMRGGLINAVGGQENYDRLGKGLEGFGKAGNALQTSGLLQQPKPAPMLERMPQSQPSPAPGVSSFQQMYGQPVMDAETLRRLQRMQQMQQMYGGGYGS